MSEADRGGQAEHAGERAGGRPLTPRPRRDFGVFWAVQTLSELGNAFALMALPLLVLRATGSVAQMGLLTGIAGAVSIATGLFAGSLVDRMDRRRLMILCDAARAVLYALIPVCWAISPQVWVLYAVMALAAVFAMTFDIAYITAVANLVDRERIVAANGRLQTTNALAYIAGPALAGVVAGIAGPTAAIGLDAASFAVSTAGLSWIRLRPRTEPDDGARPGVREGFMTGFAFLWRTPVLRALTILLSIVTFLSLGMTDIFIYQVRVGLGQGPSVVGLVLALAGAGTAVAAAATAFLRRSAGFGWCWLGSYAVCGTAVAWIGTTRSVATVAVLVLFYTFGMGLAGICSMSLRQAVTPDRLLGRVTSAFWTVHSALAPLGAAALTAAVGRYGVRGPLLAAGATFLAVVVAGLFTPIRQRHPEQTREAVHV